MRFVGDPSALRSLPPTPHPMPPILLALAAATLLGTSDAPLGADPQEGAGTPAGAVAEPGAELRVWLVTIGPGPAVWERFGHNALRVLDTTTGRDVSYNWGIFDFEQPGFVPRFLRGRMLYMMAAFPSEPMIEAYVRAGRHVVAQELDLSPAEKIALRDRAEWNALPQNRDYPYNYFLDNCSTRARDLLDNVLGGTLQARFGDAPSGTTWRDQIRRLTADDPLLFTGMDVLLGRPGDASISVWEEMFLPMTLRDALRDVTRTVAGAGARPLVLSEVEVSPALRPDPETTPAGTGAFLLLGLLLGGSFAVWGTLVARGCCAWARVALAVVGAAWSLVAGLVGTILVLVLFTDHTFMAANANIFLLTPLSLGLAVLVPLGVLRHQVSERARRLAAVVAGLALLGAVVAMVPGLRQDNAIFLALVTPAHLGLWWALHRIGRAAPV